MPASRSLALAALLLHPSDQAAAATDAHGWRADPWVLVPLLVVGLAYALGVRRMWSGGGIGAGLQVWRAGAFAGGILALALALLSPVDGMSAELSSAHMVQHELLMVVAAPLLTAGLPLLGVLWALPLALRRRGMQRVRRPQILAAWNGLTSPAVVFLVHGLAIWAWHLPALYDAALQAEWIHGVEHACFFASAMLFWWGMTRGRYGRLGYGAAVVYIFATALHTGLLGAALALSQSVWYRAYADSTQAWGLSPLEDQQVAGLIMWVPSGAIFTALGLYFFAAWLAESERRAQVATRKRTAP